MDWWERMPFSVTPEVRISCHHCKMSLEKREVNGKPAMKMWKQEEKNWTEFVCFPVFFFNWQWLSLYFAGFRIGKCGYTGHYRILSILLHSIVAAVTSEACCRGWMVKKNPHALNHCDQDGRFTITIFTAGSWHYDTMYQYDTLQRECTGGHPQGKWKHFWVSILGISTICYLQNKVGYSSTRSHQLKLPWL